MASSWESGALRITVTFRASERAFDATIVEWDRSKPSGMGRARTVRIPSGISAKHATSRTAHECIARLALDRLMTEDGFSDLPCARYESGAPHLGFRTWQ